jgi:aminoglycoside phosphotransferase family enzyme/predicted kinase
LKINKAYAPDLYEKAVPITLEYNGTLEIAGDGKPIEWAVVMRRFEDSALLSNIADAGKLDQSLAVNLGKNIAIYHLSLPDIKTNDGAERISEILDELERFFTAKLDLPFNLEIHNFHEQARFAFSQVTAELDFRALKGKVRGCHGDLHLHNIVLLNGLPTPFDALEFDERLATTDVLYDLAFLITDLLHKGLRAQANMVFNRYLLEAWPLVNDNGLNVLPLFMAIRAAIRAMVSLQTAQYSLGNNLDLSKEASEYLTNAIAFLVPSPPRLVCISGLSGTGKSTLALALAPMMDPSPGAVLLRSDLERKEMLGVDEFSHLPQEAYSPEMHEKVYQRLLKKTDCALRQGYSVVLDAVFSKSAERKAAAKVAKERGVPFDGIWLTAPPEVLLKRVADRTHDASDATKDVVRKQMKRGKAPNFKTEKGWRQIDASGSPSAINQTVSRMFKFEMK